MGEAGEEDKNALVMARSRIMASALGAFSTSSARSTPTYSRPRKGDKFERLEPVKRAAELERLLVARGQRRRRPALLLGQPGKVGRRALGRSEEAHACCVVVYPGGGGGGGGGLVAKLGWAARV